MYTLRLYEDRFAPGAKNLRDLEAQHSIAYVHEGSITVSGHLLKKDTAAYSKDVTTIEVGPGGARVWRWELVRTVEPAKVSPCARAASSRPRPCVPP